MMIKAAFFAAFFIVCGCALIRSPTETLLKTANDNGFVQFHTSLRSPVSFYRLKGKSETLSIYIEGDGKSWPRLDTPPKDPSPMISNVLNLAALDSSNAVIYLARPCQFLKLSDGRRCKLEDWTIDRYSSKLVNELHLAINQLKEFSGAKHIRLFGYSGGGVVAALLATKRNDVSLLVTIASPLDIPKWINLHGLTKLNLSENPASLLIRDDLQFRQVHLVGQEDTIVPPALTDWAKNKSTKILIVIKKGFDHECCWVNHWAEILHEIEAN